MNNEYKHARRGNGTAVHAVSEGGQLCGAGNNTISTRHSSRMWFTSNPITCKTCLKRIEARAATRGNGPLENER